MNITIIGSDGLAVLCKCGKPATTVRHGTVMSQGHCGGPAAYYCEEHNPDGMPCPLCTGAGRLPHDAAQ